MRICSIRPAKGRNVGFFFFWRSKVCSFEPLVRLRFSSNGIRPVSDEQKNNWANGPKPYDPHAYTRSGVCTPARSNDRTACPRPPSAPRHEFHDPEPIRPAGPGFYVVPYSMTAKDMFDSLFEDIPNSALGKFSDLNPDLDSYIKAGTLIVLSDLPSTFCTPEESKLMSAAREVKAALEPLTPEEANFMYRHRAEIEQFISGSSTWVGVSSTMMGKHLSELHSTLLAVEHLHQSSYRQHGHLRSPEFFAERKRLLTQLDNQLLRSTRLRNFTSFGDHDKLKTALGISSRSLVHHWNKAGAPGQIPGYATHVNAISRAAKYMKAGGYVGITLGGLSSILAVKEVCTAAPDSPACKKKKFTEGGKFMGSVTGGAAGGVGGGLAAGKICLGIAALTAPAGGSGGLVCGLVVVGGAGLGAWLGGEGGGKAGEFMGETIYEKALP